MKTFILASKNEHKAEEIRAIIGDGFNVITQTRAGVSDIDVVEDGKTFEENAIKKAETIMKATGEAVIADDSGLCVEFLDGAPGVYTARYAGEDATDGENINKLLRELDGVPTEKRAAKFVCVIAMAQPGVDTITFRGECEGIINVKECGDKGFGYDPIFYVPKYECTMAELAPQIKNEISHRAEAIKKFVLYEREQSNISKS